MTFQLKSKFISSEIFFTNSTKMKDFFLFLNLIHFHLVFLSISLDRKNPHLWVSWRETKSSSDSKITHCLINSPSVAFKSPDHDLLSTQFSSSGCRNSCKTRQLSRSLETQALMKPSRADQMVSAAPLGFDLDLSIRYRWDFLNHYQLNFTVPN